MGSGEVLGIVSTDPGSVKDFEAFAVQTGHELLESSEVNGEFHFKVKKARALFPSLTHSTAERAGRSPRFLRG